MEIQDWKEVKSELDHKREAPGNLYTEKTPFKRRAKILLPRLGRYQPSLTKKEIGGQSKEPAGIGSEGEIEPEIQ